MEGVPVAVETVREVGPDTIALELTTPEEFDASPGEFVRLRAAVDGEEITRYYTLSSPSVTDTFEITVGVDPDGDLTPWLAGRDAGDTVYVEGPFGQVAYEDDGDVVTVAGGPGIGPAVAIAEAAHDAGHDAAVIYQDDEPAHTDRLEALDAAGVSVTVVDGDDDETLAKAVAAHLEDGQHYVFGFESFVSTVADAIEAAGGDPDDALIESFG
ncbi:FAD-dependent oxidoreductase [Natrialbaceae archaeon AArc-T1-2]|uniref:FAD-dependent oxidoreductase n=1 Tax=Natrialbaceae archaeon AArc-T1-2 TaxID=3053904 RepID=UPI00255AB2C1|nr:FAD-dependent oxidoreductase [Natrialbaceae archaeon AArc-T1-2]WIV66663.1 FAD-dependent oxidoreductase [Natrialbaceae archaeon AArc-T1-2]